MRVQHKILRKWKVAPLQTVFFRIRGFDNEGPTYQNHNPKNDRAGHLLHEQDLSMRHTSVGRF